MDFVIRYEFQEVTFSKFDKFLEAYSLLKCLGVPRVSCGYYDRVTLEFRSFSDFCEDNL